MDAKPESKLLSTLVKLLAMTTSSNEQEALTSMRMANAMLPKFGANMTWERLLSGKITLIADPFSTAPDPMIRRGTTSPQPRHSPFGANPPPPPPPKPQPAYAASGFTAQAAQPKPKPQTPVYHCRDCSNIVTRAGTRCGPCHSKHMNKPKYQKGGPRPKMTDFDVTGLS